MSAVSPGHTRVFVSYSHKDRHFLSALHEMMRVLEVGEKPAMLAQEFPFPAAPKSWSYVDIADWMSEKYRALAHRAVEQDDEDGVVIYLHAARELASEWDRKSWQAANRMRAVSEWTRNLTVSRKAQKDVIDTIQADMMNYAAWVGGLQPPTPNANAADLL